MAKKTPEQLRAEIRKGGQQHTIKMLMEEVSRLKAEHEVLIQLIDDDQKRAIAQKTLSDLVKKHGKGKVISVIQSLISKRS